MERACEAAALVAAKLLPVITKGVLPAVSPYRAEEEHKCYDSAIHSLTREAVCYLQGTDRTDDWG